MPAPTVPVPSIERRAFSMTEFRVAKDAKTRTIVGYPAMFNKRSEAIYGMFYEKIAPGAFAESIAKDDIRALFNHDPNLIVGRNIAKTLRLQEDSTGLHMEIDPPETQTGRDLVISIDRGDVSQGSFGFQTLDDDWSGTEDGLPVRTLLRVRLFDVSPVTFPAYHDTDVQARSVRAIADEGRRRLAAAAGSGEDHSILMRLRQEFSEKT